jgi:hypothetical protein
MGLSPISRVDFSPKRLLSFLCTKIPPGFETHTRLNPRTLVLRGEELLLADFGLAQLVFAAGGGSDRAPLNARYSAPELSARQIGPQCDQYSLALIYHELLTGIYPTPVRGESNGPCLNHLSAAERPILARALNADPRSRFASTDEFMQALEALSPPSEDNQTRRQPDKETARADLSPCLALSLPGCLPNPSSVPKTPPRPIAVSAPVLQIRFGTNLAPEVIRQRLEGFRLQWRGELVSSDPRHLVFNMQAPLASKGGADVPNPTGNPPALEIHLHIGQPELEVPAGVQVQTEVCMDLRRARQCTREQSAELLQAVGPLLVESVRTHLRLNPYGRMHERMVWQHPLHLCAIQPDGSLGPPIECAGKDISPNGIGFYLPGQLPASHVMLHLPLTEQTSKTTIPARIVRVQGCGDGWYEVGAVLLPPHELPSEEEQDARVAERETPADRQQSQPEPREEEQTSETDTFAAGSSIFDSPAEGEDIWDPVNRLRALGNDS